MACGGSKFGLGSVRVHQQGYAVFIVNIEPKGTQGHFEFQERRGAREDGGNLQTVFCKNLGFEWINRTSYWHQNLTIGHWDHRKRTGHQFEEPMEPNLKECCLRCHIQSLDHSKSKCFILAISSHGRELTETELIFSDGESIYLTEIFDALSDENCPSLKGIPRIIILQACRSNFEDKELVEKLQDHGVNLNVEMTTQPATGATGSNKVPDKPDDFPTIDRTFQQMALYKMPENFLLVYPVVSGQHAQRNDTDGSWLIHTLKEMFLENFSAKKPVNVLHLLTQVSGYIARERETTVFKHIEGTNKPQKDESGNKIIDEERSGVKNAVCFHHRLVKPLIFYPKVQEMPKLEEIPMNFFGMKKKKKGNN